MADYGLCCPPEEKQQRASENANQLLDALLTLVEHYQIREIRESQFLDFHKITVGGIYRCAGEYRTAAFDEQADGRGISISDSGHTPPPAALVPGYVHSMIERLNADARAGVSPTLRAAYALWRTNWIHPFPGGNGRTARALTYLILCLDYGRMMPGVPTVPMIVCERRDEYIAALKHADATEREGSADLSLMETLVSSAAEAQLGSVAG